ncbi:hypothetical protein SteCoe_13872 [Stentor coeruleus]|uniref:Brl1/Brr6 domain-containing protein n=1 Tax=Stentor coeruleus TaxID=5963 RepID=A0A1R2C7F4_9CILI|nr:hypothetical protein SteCoe_13872 [Stentor coeruleus]
MDVYDKAKGKELVWNGLKVSYDTIIENIMLLNHTKPVFEDKVQVIKYDSGYDNDKRPSKKSWGPTAVLFFSIIICSVVVMTYLEFNNRVKAKVIENELIVNECTRNYLANRCHPEDRVPVTEKQCLEWEICLNQDPKRVFYIELFVEMMASWGKTFAGRSSKGFLVYTLLFGIGIIVVLNVCSKKTS